jgi:hypothetical protein
MKSYEPVKETGFGLLSFLALLSSPRSEGDGMAPQGNVSFKTWWNLKSKHMNVWP